MEQVRIVKELRYADIQRGRTGQFIRPRFMVWENVPGAFSSHKGEDFRAVLEEIARIVEPDAVIPRPPKNKWRTSGCILGDGWSIAWRVLDAQFWGVPQRRRRIALVADFGGHAAIEILFVRKGVCGDIETGETERKEIAAGTGSGADCTVIAVHLTQDPITGQDISPCLSAENPVHGQASIGVCKGRTDYLTGWDNQEKRVFSVKGVSPTLSGSDGGGGRTVCGYIYDARGNSDVENVSAVFVQQNQLGEVRTGPVAGTLNTNSNASGRNAPLVFDARANGAGKTALVFENHGQDSRITGPLDVFPTVSAKFGTGGNNTPLVMATGQAGAEILKNLCATLNCDHEQPIVAAVDCRNGTIDPEINGTLQAKPSGGMSLNLNNVVMTYPPDVARCLKAKENLSFRGDSDTLVVGAERGCLTPWDIQSRRMAGADGVSQTLYSKGKTGGAEGQTMFAGIVRRLTPLECERLQGYPDGWTDIGPWTDSAGKLHKESSDSARYKALGNSIALPPWTWVLKRLCACYERTATMASLFDGIGGFPLIWERLNGPGSCLWASEIEEFPIAVTKARFEERNRW